ncbi:RIP metalloprotease RseP [bacterium]|nr:RIP metalloprotease RseP [bacterium]
MEYLLAFGQKAFFFVIVLSAVIIVHEWGHFIVARMCGVGVDAFSLFFGKPLWKKKYGRTEWRIGAIPLGGYVKMVGQVDLDSDSADKVAEEDRPISFAHKPAWQRAAIVAAGPVMNFVLAFVIFSGLFFVGYPTTTTLIGNVSDDGAAWEAGVRPGDRVVAVDGEKVWRWDDMAEIVEKKPGVPLVFSVERDGGRRDITVTPRYGNKLNLFQFEVDAGVIGISPDGYLPIAGVRGPDTPAALAGLKTGDLIKSVNGKPVRYFTDFEHLFAQSQGSVTVGVERGGLAIDESKRRPTTIDIVLAKSSPGARAADLGIERGDLYVAETTEKSPAAEAGFLPGDRIVTAGGKTIEEWSQFTKMVRDNSGDALPVTVLRGGEEITLSVTPETAIEKDIMGEQVSFGRVGIYPWKSWASAEIVDERYWNPFKAFARGLEMTATYSYLTVKSFVYLFTGDVSLKSLGGPIMIADLAGRTAETGAFGFLVFLAVISVNLGILNLLPIPVLDGGHLAIFAAESVFRRPIPAKGLRVATNVGLFLIGCLMFAAFFNDFARIFPGLRTMFGLLE